MALTVVLTGCSGTTSTGEVDAGSDPADFSIAGPPPLITEFLAKNQAGLTDEDGATSDWIEIHNPDTVPYDLSGHFLTDSKTNSKRWAFPVGTVLAPGAYMVVFASGKNRAVAGKPLHTSFSLSGGDP
ncbi:MAG: lamin tail domain-containing protein, partial [Deltaproteobacteria bacterium]|nr:lamin tail domain-containing protein [Deltaproteobacteria bacterium]